MNDETPINEENAAVERKSRLPRSLPAPLERTAFALQERVIWPLEDRFGLDEGGPGRNRVVLGGGLAAVLAGVAIVFALTSGGGSGASSTPTTTAAQAPAPQREPLAALEPAPTPPKEKQPPAETLHGAAPVFSPPSPAGKGGEKTGASKTGAADSAAGTAKGSDASSDTGGGAESSGADTGAEATGDATGNATSTPSSPADARISSDPKNSEAAGGDTAGATAARAPVPDGPPAGPAALKVAREFAKGFVVYETGGEKSDFSDAFAASATPELTKALMQRPPKQPAGVKVPRAKVLNVVAGPSHGKVYEVSVSLLRVGVTSELRLDLEQIKKGKRVEWRVTNVLG